MGSKMSSTIYAGLCLMNLCYAGTWW